jgi:hypothetical protein
VCQEFTFVEQHHRRRLEGGFNLNDYLVEAMQAASSRGCKGTKEGAASFSQQDPSQGPGGYSERAAQGPRRAMSNLSALVQASGSRFTADIRRNTGSPAISREVRVISAVGTNPSAAAMAVP